ncbi:hypothetical protein [Chromobacterium haemolyticum]|uniref:hypothetical protein n=1 Tax=Chromobacterium haemolyticum TaxID=394935 RepID=UPI00193BE375
MDLGVAYGKPKATLTSSEGLTTAAGADIEIERKKLQDDLDKLKVWPVIKIGWGYTF